MHSFFGVKRTTTPSKGFHLAVAEVNLIVVHEPCPVAAEMGNGGLQPRLRIPVEVYDGGLFNIIVANLPVVPEAQDMPRSRNRHCLFPEGEKTDWKSAQLP